MRVEEKKYLYDIRRAAEFIADFTAGKSLTDYENDAMLRSAVERQFEVIGESLAKLARVNQLLAQEISDHRRIIGFRNVLIHGYAEVDNRMVWDIVRTKLPNLLSEASALLEERRE